MMQAAERSVACHWFNEGDLVQFVDIRPSHFPRISELNERFVHFLSPLPETDLTSFLLSATYAKVALINNEVAGFLIGFGPGADYQSENYRFFSTAFSSFLYIDRIVVDDRAPVRGIGQAFYDDVAANAVAADQNFLTCEVDIDPPNDRSLKFHEQYGFATMNTRTFEAEGKRKTVALMFKHLEL